MIVTMTGPTAALLPVHTKKALREAVRDHSETMEFRVIDRFNGTGKYLRLADALAAGHDVVEVSRTDGSNIGVIYLRAGADGMQAVVR